MKKQKSLIKNFIFNFIKTVTEIIFPILTFTYSARILGKEGIGQINFTKSVISYFMMFALLGINSYGIREAAKLRDNKGKLSKFVHEMLIINGITTLCAYLLLIVMMNLVPKMYNYRELLMIYSTGILLRVIGVEWLYQALEEYQYIAICSVVVESVAFFALFIFVRNSGDIIPYAIVSLIASSGVYIFNFINLKKHIFFRPYKKYEVRRHLKPVFWLFAMAISIELYTVLDSTMLGFMKGNASVGLYTAAIQTCRMVNTLITTIGVILIPRLSYYIGNNMQNEVSELIIKAYNYVFMMSIPATIGLFMLSDEIILLFSGENFKSAGQTMRILVLIVLVIPFSVVTNQQAFVPMGKEKLIVLSTTIGAVTNFIMNVLFIPYYSENGAAIATVLAEIMVALICLINISHYFNISSIFHWYYQYWVSAIVIIPISYVIHLLQLPIIVHMVLTVIASFLSYAEMLFLFKNPYVMEIFRTLESRKKDFLYDKD